MKAIYEVNLTYDADVSEAENLHPFRRIINAMPRAIVAIAIYMDCLWCR